MVYNSASPISVNMVLMVLFSIGIRQSNAECDDFRIRRNFLSLTRSEWKEYVQVFLKMYEHGIFDQLAAIHSANFRTIHDYPQFLIWHRYFVYDFENQMRTFNSELTLPYWDAAADFDTPHYSKVFSPRA